MQCHRRQRDPDRLADRDAARIVHQILVRPYPHRVAVKPAGIGALDDLAPYYQEAVASLVGRAQPRILTAEMGVDRNVRGAPIETVGGEQRGVDLDARR